MPNLTTKSHVHVFVHVPIGKAALSQRFSPDDAERKKREQWRSLIEGAVDLVMRMEKDRQDTLQQLSIYVIFYCSLIHL